MAGWFVKWLMIGALGAGLAACNRDPGQDTLLNLRQSAVAPDEFLVVPQKPLETPANLSVLPKPEPGAPSRVSIDFEADLMAALGGRNGAGRAIPASDFALLNAVKAGGVPEWDIRRILREEDQAYRDAHSGRLERLTEQRRAAELYKSMQIDPVAETVRLQEAGVIVPSLPLP